MPTPIGFPGNKERPVVSVNKSRSLSRTLCASDFGSPATALRKTRVAHSGRLQCQIGNVGGDLVPQRLRHQRAQRVIHRSQGPVQPRGEARKTSSPHLK